MRTLSGAATSTAASARKRIAVSSCFASARSAASNTKGGKPAPHLITRRAGYERARLLMQSASRPALQNFLGDLTKCLFEKAPRDVRWHLDVDPIEFD